MSLAYCDNCLDLGIEPWYIVVSSVWSCSGYENMSPWAQDVVDRSMQFHGKTREDLDNEIAKFEDFKFEPLEGKDDEDPF